MPQEFQVLQCYSCKTFQVHQVKKAKKWACKMCGEKQSIIKVFGRGTGAECRQHVQSLNTHRGEIDMLKETLKCKVEGVQEAPYHHSNDQDNCGNVQESGNKWSQFVDDPYDVNEGGEEDVSSYDDTQFTTDASILDKKGKSRKRKRENSVYQSRGKSNRCDDLIEQTESYDEDQSCNTRYPSIQDFGQMENKKRASTTYGKINKYTERNTTFQHDCQNEIKKYRGDEIGCHGNVNVLENKGILATSARSSKWSSFSENYQQQDNDYHVNQIQGYPDDVNRLFVSKSPSPASYNSSKWLMHEENSSQESSDYGTESQYDNRIYVNLNESKGDTTSNAPKHNTQTNFAEEVLSHKNFSNHRKPESTISKPSSSKWGQFINVDEDEDLGYLGNEIELDMSDNPRGERKNLGGLDNIENEVKSSFEPDMKRKILGATNVPLQHDSKLISNKRSVLRVNNSQVNHGSGDVVKHNASEHNQDIDNHIVVDHDVRNLFSTGDLSDDDFEL